MVLINSVLSTIVYNITIHDSNAPPHWSISGGTVVGLLHNGLKKQAALQDRLCRPTVLTRRQPVKLERPPQASRPLTQSSSHSSYRSPLFLGFLISTFTPPYTENLRKSTEIAFLFRCHHARRYPRITDNAVLPIIECSVVVNTCPITFLAGRILLCASMVYISSYLMGQSYL